MWTRTSDFPQVTGRVVHTQTCDTPDRGGGVPRSGVSGDKSAAAAPAIRLVSELLAVLFVHDCVPELEYGLHDERQFLRLDLLHQGPDYGGAQGVVICQFGDSVNACFAVTGHNFLRSALRLECQPGHQQERTREQPDRHSQDDTQEQSLQSDDTPTRRARTLASGTIPAASGSHS